MAGGKKINIGYIKYSPVKGCTAMVQLILEPYRVSKNLIKTDVITSVRARENGWIVETESSTYILFPKTEKIRGN